MKSCAFWNKLLTVKIIFEIPYKDLGVVAKT